MNHRQLLKTSLLLAMTFFVCTDALFAQGTVKTRHNDFWLDFGAGIGTSTLYDKGTIPFAYRGFNNSLKFGFTDEWSRYHIHFDGGRAKTNLHDMEGKVYGIGLNFDFLVDCAPYKAEKLGRWHFYTGVAAESFMDLKLIQDLGNAAAAFSSFGNLSVVEQMQCNFAYDKTKTHPWMTFLLRVSVPVVGFGNRPDFIYVHDDAGNNNVFSKLTNNHESYFKMFAGCTTDIGFNLNLRNGNKIGLSYNWNYITSGKKGAYRYDNAFHDFYLSFMFKINR